MKILRIQKIVIYIKYKPVIAEQKEQVKIVKRKLYFYLIFLL
jgi:hypothetical protein